MFVLSNEKRNEIKKFLEEKINNLKKELEFYELILALFETGVMKQENQQPTLKEELEEVKVDKKTIAIISRSPTQIKIRPLFEIDKTSEVLNLIRKQIELIAEEAKVSALDEKNSIKEITIEAKKLTPVLIKGISDAAKLVLIDYYKDKFSD